ncbi:MAG: M14 family zinc carboxypeptidase [Candidatus Bathyarchaeota archaeon]|nr:M14 family zinc carboxypeptidase [Candidatus Bathyarchaeota archaeon]
MKKFSNSNICMLLCVLLLTSTIIIILPDFLRTQFHNDFEECTAVIVTGTAAKDGRAILMKNRDTSDIMNKPVYYPPKDGKYGYVMVNTYWMGINEKGLAVMNTLVSALGFGGSGMDNGALNRWIIEHCETVEEVCFELNNTNGPIGPGKRQGGTCVGVIDRFGNGSFIEISGVGAYARFIVNGYDSQANHPRYYPGYASGPSGRDQYALDIMNAIYAEKGYISWEDVAQNVSRYVRNKEKGTSNFSISGEISNTITQAAMVAVSGDSRYDGKLNCMWGEYGNPPMVGLFVPSIAYAGQPPPILNSFWNYVWEKRSYAQDPSGYYIPSKVREIQTYTFFGEDYTFLKYDALTSSIPDNLADSELKTRLQNYVKDAVQTATHIYIAEPQVLTHTVTYEGNTYQIKTVSNSTISNFMFSANPNIAITFNLIGESGASGFCYLTIPTGIAYGSFRITVGDQQYTVSETAQNGYDSLLNFTYTGSNQVTITAYTEPSGFYRDYGTFITSFKSLAVTYPSLVTYETVGKTVQNKDIILFKIGNPSGGKILIDGAMHGAENLGSELLYYYARWLLTSSDPLATQILSNNYMLLIPALNVDKYGNARKNANGVDLNRNFATNWQYGGSSDPSSDYYRGTAPLSEPESQALVQAFQSWKPAFYINLHRGGSVLYGSTYCNSTYYSLLHSKIKTLANQRQVPYYSFQSIAGAGFAMSDAAKAGSTGFLLELVDWQEITLQQIETEILPKFIPIIAVLSQECSSKTVFEDGFESGNMGAWSGVTATSGTSAAASNLKSYQGSYSAKFETEAIASGTRRACIYRSISESSVVYARAYFYIDEGLPLNDAGDRFTLIQFLTAGESIIISLQVRRVSGEDRFAILALSNVATTTTVYPTQKKWFCLELFAKIHSTKGAVKAYINGAESISLVNMNTSSLGNIGIVRFGLANRINVQHNVVVYCDCACISAGYIGPRPFPRWDINQDGRIDLKDTTAVSIGYGLTPQKPNWNPSIDVNSDGAVDLMDTFIVAVHFGESYT